MDICRNSKVKSWEKTLKGEEKVNGGRANEISRIGKKETSEGGEKQENATPNYLRSTNSAKMFNDRIKKGLRQFQIIGKSLGLPNLDTINNKSRSILIELN